MLSLAIFGGCERSPTPTEAPAQIDPADPDKLADTGAQQAGAQQDANTSPLRVVASDPLPANPRRIVTLAPNVTEILFALGAGERVVAVTRYDDYPPKVMKLPKIGGIIDVDLEAILSQKPDLVVGTSAGSDGNLVAKLEKAKIPYLFIQMNTLDETYGGIQKFGEAIGLGDEAAEVRAEMESQIDAIARASDAASDARPSVLLVYGHDPLVVAGPGSFGHEMLEIAGATNAAGDAQSPYPTLDIEKVLSLNPEQIIDATIATGEDVAAPNADPQPGFWAKFATLEAVKNEQVHYFQDPVLLRPAPRLVEGLKIMHKAISSDALKETPKDAAPND